MSSFMEIRPVGGIADTDTVNTCGQTDGMVNIIGAFLDYCKRF